MLGFPQPNHRYATMFKPRHFTSALLCISTAAGAYPRSDLPSLSFTHKDWELVCNNTRTCRAAGYRTEEDAAPNATVLLTRTAGPNRPVTVELQLADDETHRPQSPLQMTIDGKRLGEVAIDLSTNIGKLSQAQANALVAAVLRDGKIGWTAGKTTWTISTAGANAVLLKMDDFQGRIGTPGALVRRGSKPESSVLPPLPLPAIKAGPVLADKQPVALTPAQSRDLMAALRKTITDDSCDLLDAKGDEAGKLEVNRLTTDQWLVSHTCWMAAYNTGDGYWVANARPPYSPVLVTTLASDYGDGVISSSQKGRGIGDCYAVSEWTWDGRTFSQTLQETSGMCRQIAAGGAWHLPTLVTRVMKSR